MHDVAPNSGAEFGCMALVELDTCLAPATFALKHLEVELQSFLCPRSEDEQKLHAVQYPAAGDLYTKTSCDKLRQIKLGAREKGGFILFIVQMDDTDLETVFRLADVMADCAAGSAGLSRLVLIVQLWASTLDATPYRVGEGSFSPLTDSAGTGFAGRVSGQLVLSCSTSKACQHESCRLLIGVGCCPLMTC